VRIVRLVALFLALTTFMGACGTPGSGDDLDGSVLSAAADHRVRIEHLLREHVFLMAFVTQAVATGRINEYEGAASALDDNAVSIARELRQQYGEAAQRSFLALWRKYLKVIPSYSGRLTRKKKAADLVKQMEAFPKQFGTLMSSITPLLNPFRTASRMKNLMSLITSFVASQAKKDFSKADSTIRAAGGQAGVLGADIARAMIDDRPMSFGGNPDTVAAAFRYTLSAGLAENILLLSLSTQGTATRRSSEAKGATAALKVSTAQLASHFGSAYGSSLQRSFATLWQRLDDLVLSYAGAGKDQAKKNKAAADVKRQATEITRFLTGANKELDNAELELSFDELIDACMSVVDAQVAGDFVKAGVAIRAAVQDTERPGEFLTRATVLRFPAAFEPKSR
jgi:hypothetical protein